MLNFYDVQCTTGKLRQPGEIPEIGESPPNPPISWQVTFIKIYQGHSRAADTNLQRRKGLARG